MIVKKINKAFCVLVLSMAMPVSVFAGPDKLWDKVSGIAANNWMEISALTPQEMKHLNSLAESGDSNAQYAMGMIYQTQHEHYKAAAWLKRAADQGHAPAHYSYNKNAAGHPDMAGLSW